MDLMGAAGMAAGEPALAPAFSAFRQQRWRQAWQIADAALRSAESADLHFIAGMSAFELRQPGPALVHLGRAAALRPERADFAVHRARVLAQARRMPEAVEEADRALRLGVADAASLDTLGVVYTRAGEHAKALPAYERAVAIDPGKAGLHYNLAACLAYFGRVEEAEREFRRVLSIDPRCWRAYLPLGQLRRHAADDHDLPQLAAALEAGQGHPEAELYVNLAMARQYEDLGDYDAAFAHLQRGKDVQRRLRSYSPEDDRALFAAIERAFPVQAPTADGYRGAAPIFVVGMPRSGTTLVDRILSSHPQVHSAGELQNFAMTLKRLVGTRTPGMIDIPTLTTLDGLDWERLGRDYVASTLPGTAASPRFVDKLPHNFLYLGHIARALPGARIICLRRDPMDTCLGNYRQLFALSSPYYDYSFDLLDTGRYYLLFDRLMAHWASCLPGRIHEVHYEELVAGQECVTRELLAFCDLPWDEACLAFERNAAPVTTGSMTQVREPLSGRYIGRWRRYGQRMDALADLLGVAIDG